MHFLYRYYDTENTLLYVGVSLNPFFRMNIHKGQNPWFYDIKRVELEKYDSLTLARRAEVKAIINEKPLYNKSLSFKETKQKPPESKYITSEHLRKIKDIQSSRDEQIRKWVEFGLTLTQIAKLLGVTRQRSEQIVKRLHNASKSNQDTPI